MGHRLNAFLSQALPQHPEYMNNSVSKQRNKTFRDLVWINDKMEEIAIAIDEEMLNKYITDDFLPPDEEDEDSFFSGEEREGWKLNLDVSDSQWENFKGWSSHISVPHVVETDTSSSSDINTSREASSDDSDPDERAAFQTVFGYGSAAPDLITEAPEDEEIDVVEELPYEECEDVDEQYFDTNRYSIRDALQVSEFLRKVAEEDVRYETDSDATDSWAQDDGPQEGDAKTLLSGSGSGTGLTCDPARIAFREIMNKVAASQLQRHTPSTSGSPRRRVRIQEPDSSSWATFDFATVRRVS